MTSLQHRFTLLSNIYREARNKNSIKTEVKIDDFKMFQFDYDYLEAKGYLKLIKKGNSDIYAMITVDGIDAVEEFVEDEFVDDESQHL